MRDWRQIPLQSKVSLAMFLISSGVLTVALAVILAFQITALRKAFERNLETVASMAAVNCAAAVASGDKATATAELASLRKFPQFSAAWITAPDGAVFVRVEAHPPPSRRSGKLVARASPVWFDGRQIGRLWIERDYGVALGELVAFFMKMAAAVFAVCVAAGWLLTKRAQHAILRPVLDLAATAERVGREHDLSLRVPAAASDEIGLLTRRFNEMLGQIESQNHELKEARRDLEAKVVALEFEIAERRRVEAALADVAQREERRIANDLHDGLGQMLTAIAFKAHLLRSLLEESSPGNANLAAQIVDFANDSIKQARDIAHGVSPVDIADNGLAVALEQLGLRVERLTGARCTVRTNDEMPGIPMRLAVEIYRICQEAAHNAARHGHANVIEIVLEERLDSLHLEIRDNGSGLPPPEQRGHGLGLGLMAHRAGRIGGTCEFAPNPGGGLVVSCVIPVAREEPASPALGATAAVDAAPPAR